MVPHHRNRNWDTVCTSCSVAVMKHHGQGSLWKKAFIWAYRSRVVSLSWWGGTAASCRRGSWSRKLGAHLLKRKLEAGRTHWTLNPFQPAPPTGNQWGSVSFKPPHCESLRTRVQICRSHVKSQHTHVCACGHSTVGAETGYRGEGGALDVCQAQ